MFADPYALAARVPAHVPPALVFDFDMYNPPGFDPAGVADIHEIWKQLHATHPKIFWTPRYGGHWVVTRFAEIARMQQEFESFSNHEPFIPRGVVPPTVPNWLDPPQHGPFRRLLMPAFLPKNLISVTDKARGVAIKIIERLAPTGRCEFVGDFAGAMPVIALLTLIQMPAEDHEYLRGLAMEAAKVVGPGATAANARMEEYVRARIAERRAEHQGDFISSLVHGEVEGRKLTDEEAYQLCYLVIAGGLDTVVSTMSFACAYLARHPEARAQIRAHPEKLDNAVEEIMRRFSTSNLGRIVRRQVELGGQKLREGDMIIGAFPLAGMDETVNADPMRFDILRDKPKHLSFGTGPHTCVGAPLARRELKIFLQEWLQRIPNFSIRPDTLPRVTTGLVNSAVELQLVWDPA
jgi:cytochrome P450